MCNLQLAACTTAFREEMVGDLQQFDNATQLLEHVSKLRAQLVQQTIAQSDAAIANKLLQQELEQQAQHMQQVEQAHRLVQNQLNEARDAAKELRLKLVESTQHNAQLKANLVWRCCASDAQLLMMHMYPVTLTQPHVASAVHCSNRCKRS
jgi:hypothetical protein